jgi:hypothetical protein
MSAKNRPVSKPMNQQFAENYDRIFAKKEIPIGEDLRPKDRVKRGLGSACVEENWDCTKKGGDV